MRNKDEPGILADCTDGTVPETPETKRPSKPGAVKASNLVLMDSSSSSDVEISGSSVMSLGLGKTTVTPSLTTMAIVSFSEEQDEVADGTMDTSHREGREQRTETKPEHPSSLKTSGSGDTACKRRQEEMCDDSAESNKGSKKRRESLTDDSADEGPEPSWKEQESMVKRLQRNFPHLNKEELRDVLHEHGWVIEDALEALRMFSEHMVECSSDDSKPPPSPKHKSTTPTPNPSTSATQQPPYRSLNQDTQTRSRRHTREIPKQDSSSEDNSSDYEASSGHLDFDPDSDEADEKLPRLKAQILDFFQKATVDELTLIAGCSVKKAQKIIELRPYKTWSDLRKRPLCGAAHRVPRGPEGARGGTGAHGQV